MIHKQTGKALLYCVESNEFWELLIYKTAKFSKKEITKIKYGNILLPGSHLFLGFI